MNTQAEMLMGHEEKSTSIKAGLRFHLQTTSFQISLHLLYTFLLRLLHSCCDGSSCSGSPVSSMFSAQSKMSHSVMKGLLKDLSCHDMMLPQLWRSCPLWFVYMTSETTLNVRKWSLVSGYLTLSVMSRDLRLNTVPTGTSTHMLDLVSPPHVAC